MTKHAYWFTIAAALIALAACTPDKPHNLIARDPRTGDEWVVSSYHSSRWCEYRRRPLAIRDPELQFICRRQEFNK